MKDFDFGKILERFADELGKQNERTEAKLDALCDLVSRLTENRIEAKKDREFDTARMERIEENQKEQGVALKEMTKTMILIGERVNSNKQKWVQIGGMVFTVVASVVSASIIMKVL